MSEPGALIRRRLTACGWLLVTAAFACGCASFTGVAPATTAVVSCEDAYRAWVRSYEALNAPDGDLVSIAVGGEGSQRRVFEVCTLAEAERFNHEIPLRDQYGSRPLIDPDFRTFADVECVDESPLLDGTPLCAEVGH